MNGYASCGTECCSSQSGYRYRLTKGFYSISEFLFLIYAKAACLLSNSYA